MKRRLLLTAALVLLAVPASAGAACEVPLASDPEAPDELSCGPQTPQPQTSGSGSEPTLILWASGYDLNPLNGNRSGIWIARVDGTQRRRLAGVSNISKDLELHGLNLPEDHPSFSPDSRRIVFTSNRKDRRNWDLWMMDVNGANQRRLTSTAGLDTEAVFSPDGTRLAFATERFGKLELAVMTLATGAVQRLTNNSVEDIEPAWRPDGQKIAFARVFPNGNMGVYEINPDGTGERVITDVPGLDHDPTYSPDGQQIVITSERPPYDPPYGNVHKIRVADGADLGDLTPEHNLAAGDPFWSRDGSLIAYFKSQGPILRSPQALFVMNQSGGGKFQIPGEAAANVHPAIGVGVDDDGDGTPNYLESGSVGMARVAPRRVRAKKDEILSLWWTHPRAWRRLDTMWLRLSSGRWLLGMVRFDVRRGTVSLFDGVRDRYTEPHRLRRGELRTPLLSLDLARSAAVAESRKRIRLDLAVNLDRKIDEAGERYRIAGRRLRVRVQANVRRGRNQEEELGRLRVLRP